MNGRLIVTAHGLDEAYFLDLLGDACNSLGRYDEAARAFAPAVTVFKANGARYAHALCLFKLAQCRLALAQNDEAMRLLRECLPIFRDLHMRAAEGRAQEALDSCAAVT